MTFHRSTSQHKPAVVVAPDCSADAMPPRIDRETDHVATNYTPDQYTWKHGLIIWPCNLMPNAMKTKGYIEKPKYPTTTPWYSRGIKATVGGRPRIFTTGGFPPSTRRVTLCLSPTETRHQAICYGAAELTIPFIGDSYRNVLRSAWNRGVTSASDPEIHRENESHQNNITLLP